MCASVCWGLPELTDISPKDSPTAFAFPAGSLPTASGSTKLFQTPSSAPGQLSVPRASPGSKCTLLCRFSSHTGSSPRHGKGGHRALRVFFRMCGLRDGREVTPGFPPHASATVLCPRADRNMVPYSSAWRLLGASVSTALVCSSDLWFVSHRCGRSVKYRVTSSPQVTDKSRTFIVCPKYCMVPTMPSGDPTEAIGAAHP